MKQINSILRTLCLTALLCMTSVNASAYVVYDGTGNIGIGTNKKDEIFVIDKDITTKTLSVEQGCAYIIKAGAKVTLFDNFDNFNTCILYVFGSLNLSETTNRNNHGIIYKVDEGTIINESNIMGPGLIKKVSLEEIISETKLSGQEREPGKPGWKDCWAKGISHGDDFYPIYYYEDNGFINEITDFEKWKTNAGQIPAEGTRENIDGQFPDSEHNYVGWKDYYKFTYKDNGEVAYYEDIDYKNKIEDLETWKNGNGRLTLDKVNGQEPTVDNDGWRDYYKLTEGNGTTTYYEDEACEIKIDNVEEWKNGEGKLCIFQLGEDCYIHNGRIIYGDVCFKDKVVYDLNVNLDVTGKITYSRTFKNTNWQPLYVPFAISYDEWKGKFDVAAINNFHEYSNYKTGEIVKTELEVRLVKDHTLKPNHPYLIKAHDADEINPQEIYLSTRKLCKSDEDSIVCSSVERKYTFTGTYQDVTGMKTKVYIFMSGGKLCRATDDNVKLSAQRWYLSIESLGSQFGDNIYNAKAMEFDIKLLDDETTGIDEVTVTRTPLKNCSEAVYNLNGMRVNDSYKGIVIKNGKKVLQK